MKLTPITQWRNQKNSAALIGKKGKIVLWTKIYVPVAEFMHQTPYPVAIVELESKEKMTLQLTDWQENDLHIGKEVVLVLRRIFTEDKQGMIPYSIKAKPV